MGELAYGRFDEYVADIAELRHSAPHLADAFATFTGIAEVVEWFAAWNTRPAIDMVAMDEFEYDFLLELEPGGRWLAFGVT